MSENQDTGTRGGLTCSLEAPKLLHMLETTLSKADEISQMLSCIALPLGSCHNACCWSESKFVNEPHRCAWHDMGEYLAAFARACGPGASRKTRDGNRVFYRIRDPNLTDLIGTIKRLYCPDFNIS